MPKPVQGTYPAYFENYITKVNETDLAEGFNSQRPIINDFFDTISEEKAGFAYAPGKWTLKELLQHVIDTERIFNYRALCFARKETASLPGFDENHFAHHSFANERDWHSLTAELKAVRRATEMLYQSFNAEMLNYSGIADDNLTTVNATGFISLGHVYHHKKIIETKYF
ncbi:MAG: DinB family protein [Ferruginibacter sp.]|nr:DinB family protein [Ferruginibacter sp.]